MSPLSIAVVGCTKQTLVLAEAAVQCGLTVTACVDGSKPRARRAADRFGAAAFGGVDEALHVADLLLLGSGKRTDRWESGTSAPQVCANRRDGARFGFDDFQLQAGLNALVVRVRDGAVGTPGFIRLRYSTTPGGLDRGLGESLDFILRTAGEPRLIFAQRSERKRGSGQLIATLTLADGAIAQVNVSSQSGIAPRMEAEVIGTTGLLGYDSLDEVVRVRPETSGDAWASIRARTFWRFVIAAIDEPEFGRDRVRARERSSRRITAGIRKSIERGKPVKVSGGGS